MSFSKQVKEELNSIQIKSNCCKKAFLFGALISASNADGDNVSVQISDVDTAEKIVFLLNSIYRCDVNIKRIKRGCFESVRLDFTSKRVSEFLAFADNCDEASPTDSIFKCATCMSAFLRGAFCSCGSVSDPQKCYTLELRVPNDRRAELVIGVIDTWGIAIPSKTQRNGVIGLFYRNESSIEDFITACGGNRSLFSFYDALIEKNVRNAENRATNCDARNISKSVAAAAYQVSAIESLISSKVLDDMPRELRITAQLRLENQDVNMSELAALHDPHISKSGLNHRLTRIIEEAKKRKLI
jgi:DNA-binding protein WhiA